MKLIIIIIIIIIILVNMCADEICYTIHSSELRPKQSTYNKCKKIYDKHIKISNRQIKSQSNFTLIFNITQTINCKLL